MHRWVYTQRCGEASDLAQQAQQACADLLPIRSHLRTCMLCWRTLVHLLRAHHVTFYPCASPLDADLACLIASPILIGLVMQHSSAAAVLVLLAWGVLCWLPEVYLYSYAHRHSPALATGQPASPTHSGGAGAASSNGSTTGAPLARSGGSWCGRQSMRVGALLRQQTQAWAIYARQPAAAAALALALLYLTVCSWGRLMAAYLSTLGLGEARLAMFRG